MTRNVITSISKSQKVYFICLELVLLCIYIGLQDIFSNPEHTLLDPALDQASHIHSQVALSKQRTVVLTNSLICKKGNI